MLVNPGTNQTVMVADPSGNLHPVKITPADMGFNRGPIRKYYGITLSLSHPWNGKWFGKIEYTFARNWGNEEGPVDTNIGQSGESVAITEQWDYWELMQGSYGLLPNDQKHQLKIYGAYAITPEWMVSGNVNIASGHPAACLGAFGPNQTNPVGYGNTDYHWCGGRIVPLGTTGFTPWTHLWNFGVTYTPAWADHKLAFNLTVFNVFNSQVATQYNSGFGTTAVPATSFGLIEGYTPPRSTRFTVSYDW